MGRYAGALFELEGVALACAAAAEAGFGTSSSWYQESASRSLWYIAADENGLPLISLPETRSPAWPSFAESNAVCSCSEHSISSTAAERFSKNET